MKDLKPMFLSFSMILPLLLIWASMVSGSENRPITIGILENRNYAYADMMRKSFDLAQDAVNRQGGINGRILILAYADGGGEKRQGVQAVEHLVRSKKVVMLAGGYSSTNALAMAQRADDLDIPFLVSTAADDRITRRHRKNIFRLNPPAGEYARGLEGLLKQKLRPRTMAIIYENSPFGTGGAMRMMWFCRENGIETTAIIPYHKERASADYFDRILAPLTHKPTEMIYLISYMRDGVQMVQRIRAAGISAHLLGGAGGFTHPEFIKAAGPASGFMMTAALWWADQPYPLSGRYAKMYRDAYSGQAPDYHGAEAYSALMVAADALRRAKSMQAADLRAALEQTRISTPFGHVVFEAYNGFERQNRQPTLVLQALRGRYECIWPPDIAMARFVLPAPDRFRQKGIRDASR